MSKHRRTHSGGRVQLAQFAQSAYVPQPNTTLNQKYGVQADAVLTAQERPGLQYFCIGNGGHYATPNGDLTEVDNYSHDPSHCALFSAIPFVMREVGNDIPAAERSRYAMRVITPKDGVNYITYWLRAGDFSSSVTRSEKRIMVNSNTTTEDYVPSVSVLSPKPQLPVPNQANPTSGTYLVASNRVRIALDAFDVAEILNAARIMFGSERLAFISEIGLVTSVTRQVSSDDGQGGTISVKEAICAQIASFIEALQPLASQGEGITLTYDIGANEPMIEFVGTP